MDPFLAITVALGVALTAYLQARGQGSWSWRRFLASVLAIAVLGGGVGALVVLASKRIHGEHPLALTLLAVGCIALGMTFLALRLRRR